MALLVSPAALLAAAAFASKEPTRPMLNGVLVMADGSVTATDGHRLINVPGLPDMAAQLADYPAARWALGDGDEIKGIIVPTWAALEAAKAAPKRPRVPLFGMVLVQRFGEWVHLRSTDLDRDSETRARLVEGPYPNWEQVMPKAEPTLSIGFDGDKLADAGKVAARLGSGVTRQIRWDFGTPLGAARFSVEMEDGRVARGLLMPLRLPELATK